MKIPHKNLIALIVILSIYYAALYGLWTEQRAADEIIQQMEDYINTNCPPGRQLVEGNKTIIIMVEERDEPDRGWGAA